MRVILWLLAGLWAWLGCWGTGAAAELPNPVETALAGAGAGDDIQQRELDLLKKRLAQQRQQLKTEQVSRIVYQTALEVAAIRGFAVHDVVDYQPLTAARLEDILVTSINRQYPGPALRHYVWVNRLFAALPENIDLIEYMKDLTTEQVAGLYDPLSKILYVRTDFDLEGPLGRMILAHEICHAMQDQNSPLTELGVDDPNNADRAMAILSIAEGDATLLMTEHLSRYGNPFGLLAAMPKMMLMDQQKLNSAPVAIQRSLLFPYLEGMRFFQTLAGRTRQHPRRDLPAIAKVGEQSAWRQEVFANPPETTEQILHPEKYLRRELPANSELPAFAWDNMQTSSSSVLGEFGIALLLEPLLGRERAARAADGWDGDQILVGDLRGEDRETTGPLALYWLTRWDGAHDAAEFAEGLEDALTTRYAGTLNWHDGAARGDAAAKVREGRTRGGMMSILRGADHAVVLRGQWSSLPE